MLYRKISKQQLAIIKEYSSKSGFIGSHYCNMMGLLNVYYSDGDFKRCNVYSCRGNLLTTFIYGV